MDLKNILKKKNEGSSEMMRYAVRRLFAFFVDVISYLFIAVPKKTALMNASFSLF